MKGRLRGFGNTKSQVDLLKLNRKRNDGAMEETAGLTM
jgi:hypothetical protein